VPGSRSRKLTRSLTYYNSRVYYGRLVDTTIPSHQWQTRFLWHFPSDLRSVVGQNHILEQLENLLYLKVWGKTRVMFFRVIHVLVKLQTKSYARSSGAAIGVLHTPHCENFQVRKPALAQILGILYALCE